MTTIYHVKSAGKDYPALGLKKGTEFWWWREAGKEIIALTDPANAPPAEKEEVEPVVAAKPKAGLRKGGRPRKAPAAEEGVVA